MRLSFGHQDREEFIKLVTCVDRMAEGPAWHHGIDIPPACPGPGDVTGFNKVGCDLLGSPFCYADGVSQIPEPYFRITGDGKQHVGVVGQEGPSASASRCFRLACCRIFSCHPKDDSPSMRHVRTVGTQSGGCARVCIHRHGQCGPPTGVGRSLTSSQSVRGAGQMMAKARAGTSQLPTSGNCRTTTARCVSNLAGA